MSCNIRNYHTGLVWSGLVNSLEHSNLSPDTTIYITDWDYSKSTLLYIPMNTKKLIWSLNIDRNGSFLAVQNSLIGDLVTN